MNDEIPAAEVGRRGALGGALRGWKGRARHPEFTQPALLRTALPPSGFTPPAVGAASARGLLLLSLGAGLGIGLSACGQDTPSDVKYEGESADGGEGDGGDGGATGGPCESDDECPSGQICEEQACVAGDRNNSAAEAEALRFGDDEDFSAGTINPAGDVDYFVFEADGGEYIRINTVVEGEDDDESRNTVLRLERANGKPMTSADEFATGTGVTGVDAVMFAYIDEPGLYYVIVEDIGTAIPSDERPPEGSASYRYQLSLQEWPTAFAESDSAEAPSLLLNLDAERLWTSIGALMEAPGDVDHLGVEVILDGYDLFLDGNEDLRGSELNPRVRLIDSAGQVWMDKAGLGVLGTGYVPRVPAGTYRVELSDQDGGGSGNHWMFLHTIAREAITDFEVEREGNDSLPAAAALTQEELENSGGNLFTQARLEGAADGPADEDWFRFEADYEANWLVACSNGALYGALSNPALEIYDAGGERVAAADPDPSRSPNAVLENLELSPGTYYLRMVHPAEAEGGPGEWYRTNVYVASFEVGGYSCP